MKVAGGTVHPPPIPPTPPYQHWTAVSICMCPLPDSDYRMGRDVWLHIAGVGYPGLVLAWLLPVLALLGLTCSVQVDGFHRGFRA